MFRLFRQRKGENKMSQTMILSTIFEVSAIIIFIIGLLNEKAIIEFEDRLALAVAKRIKKHIRRKMLKKRAKKAQNGSLIQRQARLQTYRVNRPPKGAFAPREGKEEKYKLNKSKAIIPIRRLTAVCEL